MKMKNKKWKTWKKKNKDYKIEEMLDIDAIMISKSEASLCF